MDGEKGTATDAQRESERAEVATDTQRGQRIETKNKMAARPDDELSKRFDEHVKPLLAINDKLRKLTKLEDDR